MKDKRLRGELLFPPLNIKSALLWAKAELAQAGVDEGWRDARLLLAYALNCKIEYVTAYPEALLSASEMAKFSDYIHQRRERAPVSRIIGTREFWSLPFEIGPAVLDPRPDSEILVEAVIKDHASKQAPLRILDLGTGSGCLLLALLSEYPIAVGVGIDIDFAALQVAQKNARLLNLASRCVFRARQLGQGVKRNF